MKLFLILLLSMPAYADPVAFKLSWNVPATRVNGKPLTVAEIARYDIAYSVTGGAEGTATVTGGSTTSATTTIDLAPRAEPYSVLWVVSATDTQGNKSPLSAMVETSTPVTPLPPTVEKLKAELLSCKIDNAKVWAANSTCNATLKAVQKRLDALTP